MRAAKKGTYIRQPVVISLLGLATLLLLLLITVAGAGQITLQPLDFTPSAYAYLPLVASEATPVPSSIPPDDIENEQSIAEQINGHRTANGLSPLALASELTQAARRHSRDMADNNFTGHTGSDGSNAGQRMEEAGYDWSYWGEIIGWGFGGDPSRMVDWWMNSSTHRSLILSTRYEDFGVGYARNPDSDFVHYWTVNFGKRATPGGASDPALYTCRFSTRGPLGGSSLILHSPEPCQ